MKTLNHHSKNGLQFWHANIFSNNGVPKLKLRVLDELHMIQLSKPKEGKITGAKSGFITRISPFLLFAVFLAGYFPYILITASDPIQNKLILALCWPFSVINIFYFDWVLWNYFNGKKLLYIWLIELALSFVVYLAIADL